MPRLHDMLDAADSVEDGSELFCVTLDENDVDDDPASTTTSSTTADTRSNDMLILLSEIECRCVVLFNYLGNKCYICYLLEKTE